MAWQQDPGISVLRQYQEVPTGTVDGSNATFTIRTIPNLQYPTLVFRNGLLMMPSGDYVISGATLRFLGPGETSSGVTAVPQSGDTLQIVYWR
jgi:hypothetical protein